MAIKPHFSGVPPRPIPTHPGYANNLRTVATPTPFGAMDHYVELHDSTIDKIARRVVEILREEATIDIS